MMEKLYEYVDSIVNNYTYNNTIFISEIELTKKEDVFELLKDFGVTCNAGDVIEKEFYYVLPKCYYKGRGLAGMVLTNFVLEYYYDSDRDNLREDILSSLLSFIAAESPAFYQNSVYSFLNIDGMKYVILRQEYLQHLENLIKQNLKTDAGLEIHILSIPPNLIVAAVPGESLPDFPQYSAVIFDVKNDTVNVSIIPVTREELYDYIISRYNDVKTVLNEVLKNNRKLRELLDYLLS